MNQNKWSKEEIDILRENYPTLSREEIEERLVNRSWHSIRCQASFYRIRRKQRIWKEEEVKVLRQHYPYESMNVLSELLPGRTSHAIELKAYYLRIRKAKPDKIRNEIIEI